MNEVGSTEAFTVGARSCVRSVGRMLIRRVRRGREVVDDEYHGGHWARMLQSRAWESAYDLESFLVGSNASPAFVRVGGRIHRASYAEYYRHRLTALPEFLHSMMGERGDLVELGSGFGYNLFSIALAWPEAKLTGLELSDNGIAAARQIAGHFGLSDRLSFDSIDLTAAGHPNFARTTGQRLFTFFCLEQIPYDIERVVENILAARPKRVVHVEPGIDMLQLGRPSDWPNYLYVKSVDYQTRLFDALGRLQERGKVRILRKARMPFAPTIQNDGFAIAWEPA